ncbi:MAG: thrombospondin type 3 repeat-containing protein [Fimbriimonadaceae bacterium]
MRHLLLGLIGCAFIGGAMSNAQTATDVNEGSRLTQDATTGVYELAWWGKAARTYFIQHSDDLVTWTYVPIIEWGASAGVTAWNFSNVSGAPRSFFRLRHSDAATGGNPDTADFDGDGLTNLQEIEATGTHTDPLVMDTDGDGFHDGVEVQAGTNANDATATPLVLGQTMLANVVGLWTAYLPISQTGSYNQQVTAYGAAMAAQNSLQALLAQVGGLMPGSGLMDPVAQPLNALPTTMPQTQTPPTTDTGKAWLDTWAYSAWVGFTPESLEDNTKLRFTGPSLDDELSMYVYTWDDEWRIDRPLNLELKFANFVSALMLTTDILEYELDKVGDPLADMGPSDSDEWGSTGFTNPISELRVHENTQWLPWALLRTYRVCDIRVERAADVDRTFTMMALNWKPATGWLCEGTVKFQVAAGSRISTVEKDGLPSDWFRILGGKLEMGADNPLPEPLRDPLLPAGFVLDSEKYKLVPLPAELYTDLNNDGELTIADSRLTGQPYASAATEEQKDKGTEFVFADDAVSNGAWDKQESGSPATADDDDAEELHIKPGIGEGEVWLEHPAIDGLKFYTTRQCTEEIQISPSQHFTLTSNDPWPDNLFVKAEGSIEFPPTDPQVEGDLKLMYKPVGSSLEIEVAKMKLTVVQKLGATKHCLAAIDYIKENNTKLYTNKVEIVGETVPFVVLLQAKTYVQGINAHTGTYQGIDAVSQAPAWHTSSVIINTTYAYNHVNDNDFYQLHGGEMVSASGWDTTCSVKGSVAWPDPYYMAGGATGTVDLGAGDFPLSSYVNGSGGLRPDFDAEGPFTSITQLTMYQEKVIVVASAHDGIGSKKVFTDYKTALELGATSATSRLCDGGSSCALAIANPDGALKTITTSKRHSAAWVALLKNHPTNPIMFLKTYVAFEVEAAR